jgi:hypothetical protein
MLAVGGGDAGRLLATMLKCVEAKICLASGVGMAVNGDDAALFVELWVVVSTIWVPHI